MKIFSKGIIKLLTVLTATMIFVTFSSPTAFSEDRVEKLIKEFNGITYATMTESDWVSNDDGTATKTTTWDFTGSLDDAASNGSISFDRRPDKTFIRLKAGFIPHPFFKKGKLWIFNSTDINILLTEGKKILNGSLTITPIDTNNCTISIYSSDGKSKDLKYEFTEKTLSFDETHITTDNNSKQIQYLNCYCSSPFNPEFENEKYSNFFAISRMVLKETAGEDFSAEINVKNDRTPDGTIDIENFTVTDEMGNIVEHGESGYILTVGCKYTISAENFTSEEILPSAKKTPIDVILKPVYTVAFSGLADMSGFSIEEANGAVVSPTELGGCTYKLTYGTEYTMKSKGYESKVLDFTNINDNTATTNINLLTDNSNSLTSLGVNFGAKTEENIEIIDGTVGFAEVTDSELSPGSVISGTNGRMTIGAEASSVTIDTTNKAMTINGSSNANEGISFTAYADGGNINLKVQSGEGESIRLFKNGTVVSDYTFTDSEVHNLTLADITGDAAYKLEAGQKYSICNGESSLNGVMFYSLMVHEKSTQITHPTVSIEKYNGSSNYDYTITINKFNKSFTLKCLEVLVASDSSESQEIKAYPITNYEAGNNGSFVFHVKNDGDNAIGDIQARLKDSSGNYYYSEKLTEQA